MDIDTYRYLMSALIQVFGALFVGDAVFFGIRYNSIKEENKNAKYNLGVSISCVRVGQHISQLDILRESQLQGIKMQAGQFLTLNEKELKAKRNEAINGKKNNIEWENDCKQIDANYALFIETNGLLAKGYGLVLKTMLLPSVLCVIFMVGLLFADKLQGVLFEAAWQFILIAIFGFGGLIYWARDLMKG